MRELAEKTGVSRRSVYYDVCNINDCLDSHNLPPLKIRRGKGIFIPPAERIAIDALADKKDERNEYIFSPGERAKIIACYIIQSKTPVYVEQLMEACIVSRNTIFSDIQILIRQLHEYNAKLSYAPKTGYKITGDVIHVRALYFLFFDALRVLLENGQLSFFNRDEINAYFQRLSEVKAELKVDYVEGNLYSLAALLPIMKDSTDGSKNFCPKRKSPALSLTALTTEGKKLTARAVKIPSTGKKITTGILPRARAERKERLKNVETQHADEKDFLDLLTAEKIFVTDEQMTWPDAIYFAGEPLIRDGSIVEKYLDAIISQTMYYGTYMFINSDVMLAHAKPQDGVNRLNMSLTIFKKTFVFNENKAAKIIFMLCAEDNERHLKIMNDLLKLAAANADSHLAMLMKISELLQDEDKAEKIFAAQTVKELYGYFED